MTTLTNKPPKLDEEISNVIKLKKSGDFDDALKIAEKLFVKYDYIGSVCGLLASIHFELDHFDEAAKVYKKAITISPKSETASLGLFHSLWHVGDTDGAFEEMKRYMTIAKSDEYEWLLKNFIAKSDKDRKDENEEEMS